MKLECLIEKLVGAVTKAERVAGRNLTLPILKTVLINAKGSEVIIRSTNLDLGIEISFPAKIEKEGTVAVPADVLRSFLANLVGENKILLESKDGVLHLASSHSKTTIKTFPHEEFPSIPHITSADTIKIPVSDFVSGLQSVWYSASPSSMKPELSSVYIYPNGERMYFVATDSFRLAEKNIRVKKMPDFESLLIPHKNVSHIIRLFSDEKGTLTLNLTKNQISLTNENLYVTSRVIDGTFPDYRQIIPKEHTAHIIALKEDVVNAFKISTVFSDKFNQVTLAVQRSQKRFEVRTHNADVGESDNIIDASIKGGDIEMNFNYRYIVDVFQSIPSDSVSLSLAPGKPMIVEGVGDSSFLYLVMPMSK